MRHRCNDPSRTAHGFSASTTTRPEPSDPQRINLMLFAEGLSTRKVLCTILITTPPRALAIRLACLSSEAPTGFLLEYPHMLSLGLANVVVTASFHAGILRDCGIHFFDRECLSQLVIRHFAQFLSRVMRFTHIQSSLVLSTFAPHQSRSIKRERLALMLPFQEQIIDYDKQCKCISSTSSRRCSFP